MSATIPLIHLVLCSLTFLRSEAYLKYFEYRKYSEITSANSPHCYITVDKAGGFFYERWGDAPVHSIAAALFLRKATLLGMQALI